MRPAEGNYYTQPKIETETFIEETRDERDALGVALRFGVVSVMQEVVAFQRKRMADHEVIDLQTLDLPEQNFVTQALWYELPDMADALPLQAMLGALHAAEHSQIAVLPLIAMCDRWDIGGLSTNLHHQTGCPTIFIYDGHPGGVGITRRGFDEFERLVGDARRLLAECPCEAGCPSCVQSPKCGNLNEPLSKHGALDLMGRMLAAGRGGGPRGCLSTPLRGGDRPEPLRRQDCALCHEVGRGLAAAGFILVTGGEYGAMEAASRGAHEAGGMVVGLLPGTDRARANRYSDVTVVTGIGHARNLGVVASADVVVAVGGEWGTLSEIGFAGVLGRPVVLLAGWRLEHELRHAERGPVRDHRRGGRGASPDVASNRTAVHCRGLALNNFVTRRHSHLDARRCRLVRGRCAGTSHGRDCPFHRSSRPRRDGGRAARSDPAAWQSRRCRPASGGGGTAGRRLRPGRPRGGPILTLFNVSPAAVSPAAGGTVVRFQVRDRARRVRVRLAFMSLADRTTYRVNLGGRRTGRQHTYSWTRDVPAGAYRVRITARNPRGRKAVRSTTMQIAAAARAGRRRRASLPDRRARTRGAGAAAASAPRATGTPTRARTSRPRRAPRWSPSATGTISWRAYQAGGAGHYLVLDARRRGLQLRLHAPPVGEPAGPQGRPRRDRPAHRERRQHRRLEGPHLHFEVWDGPWYARRQAGRPVSVPEVLGVVPSLRTSSGLRHPKASVRLGGATIPSAAR